jgi:hypothetical protein
VRAQRRTRVRFGRVKLGISDWSDRQRELRTLIFLSDDHRNRNPMSGSSDVLAFWYREGEFPYEGHQERPGLRDTWMDYMCSEV